MKKNSGLKGTGYQSPGKIYSLLIVVACFMTFFHIDWGMPNKRSRAFDNLVLDGVWAHQGKNLSEYAVDVYPPICYVQMDVVFKFIRPVVRAHSKRAF